MLGATLTVGTGGKSNPKLEATTQGQNSGAHHADLANLILFLTKNRTYFMSRQPPPQSGGGGGGGGGGGNAFSYDPYGPYGYPTSNQSSGFGQQQQRQPQSPRTTTVR